MPAAVVDPVSPNRCGRVLSVAIRAPCLMDGGADGEAAFELHAEAPSPWGLRYTVIRKYPHCHLFQVSVSGEDGEPNDCKTTGPPWRCVVAKRSAAMTAGSEFPALPEDGLHMCGSSDCGWLRSGQVVRHVVRPEPRVWRPGRPSVPVRPQVFLKLIADHDVPLVGYPKLGAAFAQTAAGTG